MLAFCSHRRFPLDNRTVFAQPNMSSQFNWLNLQKISELKFKMISFFVFLPSPENTTTVLSKCHSVFSLHSLILKSSSIGWQREAAWVTQMTQSEMALQLCGQTVTRQNAKCLSFGHKMFTGRSHMSQCMCLISLHHSRWGRRNVWVAILLWTLTL